MTAESDQYRKQRLENQQKLEELGYPAFGGAFERDGSLAEIRSAFEEDKRVAMAGRLMSFRDMGKSIFADISDGTERFQVYAQKKELGNDTFAAFGLLDIGDHIGVEGTLFVTRMGEQTLKISKWTLLAKALLPLPEKWHGLKDVEARYRQRSLDLISNPDVRERFNKRSKAIHETRVFLRSRGFAEVETPMIQSQPGGAIAEPFKTHYGALGADMFLRIAPELYLKRLLVGGFDKVFELNRNFRNEGLDRTHIPEFTMLEIYEAYADARGMQALVKDLVAHVAETVFGTLTFGDVDLAKPWKEVPYHELIVEKMGSDWFDLPVEKVRAKAEALDLEIDPAWDMVLITQEVFEKTIERTLVQPTFVTRLPAELVPLAKNCEDDPSVVDVFELIIAGNEIAPGYSELNDPVEQRRRLEERADGDPSKIDEDFLLALEHGMPPAGGMGIGIDRLLVILSGVEAIRDVILFPQLRPKA